MQYSKIDLTLIYIYNEPCVIYCDIPYRNTTKYTAVEKEFDYEKFYNWCREMSRDGHIVYISEYNMPEDFECVWTKSVKMKLDVASNSKNAVEKLFTYLP